ncbi:hypothetical protein ACWDUL_10670 [Nocardia niigatensis]|nr:hypothetical protein [Nocardia niigatensis]
MNSAAPSKKTTSAISMPLMPVVVMGIFVYRILQFAEATYYRWRTAGCR